MVAFRDRSKILAPYLVLQSRMQIGEPPNVHHKFMALKASALRSGAKPVLELGSM